MRATPEQSQAWLYARMDELGIASLAELAEERERLAGEARALVRAAQEVQARGAEGAAADEALREEVLALRAEVARRGRGRMRG